MSEAIPHADLIRAVLDGKTVQMLDCGHWYDCEANAAIYNLAACGSAAKFRIKPDPVVMWTLPKLNAEQFSALKSAVSNYEASWETYGSLYVLIRDNSTAEET